ETHAKGFQVGHVSVRDASGKSLEVSKKHVSMSSAAVAMTLRCLMDHEEDLAAKVIAAAPGLIIRAICSLPFSGNIFSSSALLAIIKELTPPNNQNPSYSNEMILSHRALGQCISHYLQFPPIRDLQPAISHYMKATHSQFLKQDLLLQNPGSFLHEI